jgi:hypothetical protein
MGLTFTGIAGRTPAEHSSKTQQAMCGNETTNLGRFLERASKNTLIVNSYCFILREGAGPESKDVQSRSPEVPT